MKNNNEHPSVVSLESERRLRRDPPPRHARGGALPGRSTPNELGLPSDWPCPVVPLGHNGEYCFFIDSSGQFRKLHETELGRAGIESLFAASPNFPRWAWPRRFGDWPRRFDTDKARVALFFACSYMGVIRDPRATPSKLGLHEVYPWNLV